MKNIVATGLVVMFLGLVTSQAQASQVPKGMQYHGTDSMGLAIVEYKGITYHITETDTLAGITYEANEVSKILVRVQGKHHHTYQAEIPFTKGK